MPASAALFAKLGTAPRKLAGLSARLARPSVAPAAVDSERPATGTSGAANAADSADLDDGSAGSRNSYRGPLIAAAIVLAVLAVAALVFAATGLGVQNTLPAAGTAAPGAPVADGNDGANDGSANTSGFGVLAANWVNGAVGQSNVVACDVSVCGYLRSQGFPATSLVVVRNGVSDVEQADVLVCTPLLRSQFGAKLDTVLSPEPLAVFGSGADAAQVYAIALDGRSAYASALRTDRSMRNSIGAQLLANTRITLSPSARQQLQAGEVDTRVAAMLALLSGMHSLAISDFTQTGPGAGADVPSPGVVITSLDGQDVTPNSPAANLIIQVATAQMAPYSPLSATASGEGVELLFAQPGPLGLIAGSGP